MIGVLLTVAALAAGSGDARPDSELAAARRDVAAITRATPARQAALSRAALGRLLAGDDPDAALEQFDAALPALDPQSFAAVEASGYRVVATCGAKGIPACVAQIAPAGEAVSGRTLSTGTERERVAQLLSNLANLAQAGGRPADAAAILAQAMALLDTPLDRQGAPAAVAYANAAYQVLRLGATDQAADYLGRSIAIVERTRGAAHADLVDPLTVLGETYIRSGRYDRAGEVLRRAVAIADADRTVAVTPHVFALTTLGGFYAQTGRREAGLALFDRSMALGEYDPAVARQLAGVYRNVASIHVEMENWDRGRALLDKALAGAGGAAGKQSSAYGGVLVDIADLEFRRGRLDEAQAAAEGARAAYAAALDAKNPRIGDPLLILAKVAEARGDRAGAAALFDAALAGMATRAPSSLSLIAAQMSAGQCYASLADRVPRGVVLARRAADAMTQRLVSEAQLAGVTAPASQTQPGFYDAAIAIGWTASGRR